jgi:hypothetical protein
LSDDEGSENDMKQLIAGLFAAALCASPAFAQEKKGEMTEQQKRMGDCSRQASEKGMKGDDRNKFMSTCLKGGGDKTAACNAQADEKKLHGAARDSFVKKCAA